MDPLQQAMTIASTTSIIYRQNFLPKDTIGLIPPGGYRKNDVQSVTALIWLKYITETEGIHIQHARNGGEKKIYIGNRTYKVDGYAAATNTIYEFYGCVYHGCPRCFKNRGLKLYNEPKTMEERFQNTLSRARDMKRAGYNVRIYQYIQTSMYIYVYFRLSNCGDAN
ncbi:MAG: hypothetical protein GY795_47485 [Desulfobacterales bacterium]|nr:hypothetical protein [Desulfobacterales bacterium]